MTGWVALVGHIIGTVDNWGTVYDWDGTYYADKKRAVSAGFIAAESDDFNLGYVENGKLTWFGWMDDKHPDEGYPAVAEQFGWRTT